jgi:predicted amidohydrolase
VNSCARSDIGAPSSGEDVEKQSPSIRIAVAQILGRQNPFELDALRACGRDVRLMMREAASKGARLVHFHEGALSTYPDKHVMSVHGPQDLGPADWSRFDWGILQEELAEIAALARKLGLWTILGAVHRLTPPHRPHNSLHVISDQGQLVTRYDKRFISNSEILYLFSPGREPTVFDVDGFRFGCAICIEVHFPEPFLEYERLGVDCLLFSSYSEEPMFGVMAQAHAVTNGYWLSVAVPSQYSRALASGIISPNGRWLTQGPQDGTTALVVGELDRTGPEVDIPLYRARPWRRTARSGLYEKHFVTDPRSENRGTF